MDRWPHQERSASHEIWPTILVRRLIEYELYETFYILLLSQTGFHSNSLFREHSGELLLPTDVLNGWRERLIRMNNAEEILKYLKFSTLETAMVGLWTM